MYCIFVNVLTKLLSKAKVYTTLCLTYSNGKVNSVQEACAKCFAVQILKFEILQITEKN